MNLIIILKRKLPNINGVYFGSPGRRRVFGKGCDHSHGERPVNGGTEMVRLCEREQHKGTLWPQKHGEKWKEYWVIVEFL